MSLWSKLKKFGKAAAGAVLLGASGPGAIFAGIGALSRGTPGIAPGGRGGLPAIGTLPAIGMAGPMGFAGGRGAGPLPGISPGGIPAITGLPRGALPSTVDANGMPICPSGYHFEKQGKGYCVRNRRMNPLNPRAARRSIRRIKGVQKISADIRKALPKARTSRRATPAGHHPHLTHN